MRRRNHYKFSGKKHSKRGMLAGAFAVASLFALIYLVGISFRQSGNGSIYLGSVGILALVAALVSFVQAVKSLREEDTFREIPIAAMVLSVVASGSWIALYTAGFLI